MVTGSLIMSQKAEITDAFKELTTAINVAVGNPDKHTKNKVGTVESVNVALSDKTVNTIMDYTIMDYLNRLIIRAEKILQDAQCDELV